MSRDWLHFLRDLADALEQTERANDPPTRQLIVRARTLAYQEEAARWRAYADDASSTRDHGPQAGGASPPVA